MFSAYRSNDVLLALIDSVTGPSADLDAAEEAFQSCRGDFAARFAAAVQAAVAGQFRPEVFIDIPERPEEMSKAQLDALVRPASAWLKSYPSKPELLDELSSIGRRQQRRPAWIPRTTADGKPFEASHSGTDAAETQDAERDVVVEAFPELGQITVQLPAAWDERPELALADGGIGQLELALYGLLRIDGSGDWRGDLILDAEANEALVPEQMRWWAHGDGPRPLPASEDAGVASELLATVPTLGGVPIQETDESVDVVVQALAGASFWRHSPPWILQSWDPAESIALFTAADACLAAWADETGSGLLAHVDGALLHQHEGVHRSPGPLHSYLLCITRAANGGDKVATIHRLTLTCPGEHWCRRGGCTTADAATFEILAPVLLPATASTQVAAAVRRHDPQGMFHDLYGPGRDQTPGEPVMDICAWTLEQAGWTELNRVEVEGGMQEVLARNGDRFLVAGLDPLTRQIMLRDGVGDLEMVMQMLGEDGAIITADGQDVIDTSDHIVDAWGLDVLTVASDVLRGRVDIDRKPAFEPVQATLLGLHPASLGLVTTPDAGPLCQAQVIQLLHHIEATDLE